ncbi:aspartyl-phosphate phosphatase Spo0E family protein [Bacillus sp. AFS041924]|uniref:aspartyl-phosphate phosphatase Spo0E family protein n=1 Tax=Bacillus sp. AFS041924 TaxID=2033503 RepID=UPI000BFC2536|nr:aspartyl-phosphate phosphatase Spo0E family protein [Bacillus sp. AFS041924]PGS46138.1 stage 0 sporulation protein [Bacillus sp. AFS041924]
MNEYQLSRLLLSISLKREEMVYFAETKGLNEHMTLKASQELDELIISYQKKLLNELNKSFSLK